MDDIMRGKIQVIALSVAGLREQVRELWLEETAQSSADAAGHLGRAAHLLQEVINQLDRASDSSQDTALA